MTISIKNTISILTLIFSLSYSNSYDFPYRFSINRYTNEWNQNFRSSPNSLTKSTLKSPAQNFTNKVEEYIVNTQKEDNAGNPDITTPCFPTQTFLLDMERSHFWEMSWMELPTIFFVAESRRP